MSNKLKNRNIPKTITSIEDFKEVIRYATIDNFDSYILESGIKDSLEILYEQDNSTIESLKTSFHALYNIFHVLQSI